MNTKSTHPALVLADLVYRYHADQQPVIQIPRFELKKGDQAVLTGSSGIGKSTLLHLISGLMDPQSGTISINNTAINTLASSKRDRFRGINIGMIFQTFHLLQGFSAKENILAALMFSDLPKHMHESRSQDLLSRLEIHSPDQRVETLSVGQQQRVAVARAIACSPALVLADEPTAALDPEHAAGAMDLLQSACRSIDAALLCVTHDHTLIPRFDHHHRLEDLNTARGSTHGDD